jgi:hypothetical protein
MYAFGQLALLVKMSSQLGRVLEKFQHFETRLKKMEEMTCRH